MRWLWTYHSHAIEALVERQLRGVVGLIGVCVHVLSLCVVWGVC